MKKTLQKTVLILVLQAVLPVIAQDTNSYFGKHSCWTFKETIYTDNMIDFVHTRTCTLSGDTLINNLHYKQYSEYPVVGLRQEDKKVFAINADSETEYLLYDFGLEVGDSVSYITDWGEETTVYVELVDSVVLYNGEKRKQMIMTNDRGSTVWTEGIITLFSPPYPVEHTTCMCGTYYDLICLVRDGEKLLSRDDYWIKCNCEEYIPMLVSDNQWNELAVNSSMPPEYQYERTYVSKLGNDTIIDEQNYFKFLTAKDELSSVWETVGFVREDIKNKKVYFKQPNKPEVLLYDFDVETGDIILSHDIQFFFEEVSVTVENVEDISINGITRKKISTCAKYEDVDNGVHQENHVWIEGIGCLDGLLRSTMAVQPGGGEPLSLLCFQQNEILIYKPEEIGIEDCFVWRYINNGINENSIFDKIVIEIKNNNMKILIKEENILVTISLFNMQGKLLYEANVHSNTDIQLDSGAYIIKIDGAKKSIRRKILI